MKAAKIICYLAVLGSLQLTHVLAVIPTPVSAQHRIVLSLEKEQYLVDEDIWFEAIEENLTRELVISSIFRPSALDYCEIVLVDSRSDTLHYRGLRGYIPYMPERWNGHELHPGEQRYLVKQLHGIFGSQDESHDISFYLPPGRYSLQVLLHTQYGWPIEYSELARRIGSAAALRQVDRKTIRSNVVDFEIVEPQGTEREVHEKLLQAGRLEWEMSQESDVYLNIYQIHKEIVTQYPNSVYAINSYAHFHYFSARKAGHQLDLEKQLALFHDRTYAYSVLSNNTLERKQALLLHVQTNYPGSKANRYLENQISGMKERVRQ